MNRAVLDRLAVFALEVRINFALPLAIYDRVATGLGEVAGCLPPRCRRSSGR